MDHYLLYKSLHIMSFTAWMAGMFYLPRLYVYHADAPVGSPQSELFKIMERRLLRAIINPAMISTWIFGVLLAMQLHWGAPQHWLHAKLTLLLAMQLLHAHFARTRRQFARDERPRSHRYYRVINEVVTLVFVGIVVLVIFKPF